MSESTFCKSRVTCLKRHPLPAQRQGGEERIGCLAEGLGKEMQMRLDKFLKVSRLIKRRTVANEACDAGRVSVNGKPAKASATVKVGDVIEIGFGIKTVKVRVLALLDTTKKEEAKDLFEYLA